MRGCLKERGVELQVL